MPVTNYSVDLFRQMSWADSLLWQSVLKTPGAWDDEKLPRILYHFHAAQHAFLCIWEERPVEIPEPTSFSDLISIAKWGHGFHKDTERFLRETDEKELTRKLSIPWTYLIEEKLGRPAGAVTLEESMIQVALHSAHHRGQVNSGIRELGGEPPLIDYIGWLWAGKPTAGWNFIYILYGKEA